MFDAYIKNNQKIQIKNAREIRFDYNAYIYHLLRLLSNPEESFENIFKYDPRYIMDTSVIEFSAGNVGRTDEIIKGSLTEDIVLLKNLYSDVSKTSNMSSVFQDIFSWKEFINRYSNIIVEVSKTDLLEGNLFTNK